MIMKPNRAILSPEQVDYLIEMMNIGTGVAATALTQLLEIPIHTTIPIVRVGIVDKILLSLPLVSNDPSQPVIAVRMRMVGACTGDLFFIVPQANLEILVRIAAESTAKKLSPSASFSSLPAKPAARPSLSDEMVRSMVSEIGNIIAGVYLAAIYEFCGLSILHTVPVVSTDMIQALIDESIALIHDDQMWSIIVENKFNAILAENYLETKEGKLTTYLLIVPSNESVLVLAESIEKARTICFGNENERDDKI